MTETQKNLEIETAIEGIRLAKYAIQNAGESRGWQRTAFSYCEKAEQRLNAVLAAPQYADVSSDRKARAL